MTPAGAAVFTNEVGIIADDELCKAFAAVPSLVDDTGVTLADLVEAASMPVNDADTAVTCLQALSDVDGEPLLASVMDTPNLMRITSLVCTR